MGFFGCISLLTVKLLHLFRRFYQLIISRPQSVSQTDNQKKADSQAYCNSNQNNYSHTCSLLRLVLQPFILSVYYWQHLSRLGRTHPRRKKRCVFHAFLGKRIGIFHASLLIQTLRQSAARRVFFYRTLYVAYSGLRYPQQRLILQ